MHSSFEWQPFQLHEDSEYMTVEKASVKKSLLNTLLNNTSQIIKEKENNGEP